MSMYAVDGEILNGIAHAIQSKTGSDEPMTVASMAAAIEGISGGGMNIPPDTGLSKIWCGTYEPEVDQNNPVIPHGLGEVPKVIVFYLLGDWGGMDTPAAPDMSVIAGYAINQTQVASTRYRTEMKHVIRTGGTLSYYAFDSYNGFIGASNTDITFHSSSQVYFRSGSKYIIITLA